MPRFKFVGDPRSRDTAWMSAHPEYAANDPGSVSIAGIVFVLNGEPVAVADDVVVARLRGNGHFEEVGDAELAAGPGDSPESEPADTGTEVVGVGSVESEPPKRSRGRSRKDVAEHPTA